MKCPTHPSYRAIYPPASPKDCECWTIWKEVQGELRRQDEQGEDVPKAKKKRGKK